MSTPEVKLLDIFNRLSEVDQATLLVFAEFLQARASGSDELAGGMPVALAEPQPIERPAEETIIDCLKRLAKTYPMLDKARMLKATSDLVATNIMKGGDTAAAIDELEEIFRMHYERMKNATGE